MSAWWIIVGPALWALHFGAVYAIVAWACARGAPHIAQVGVVSVSLLALSGAIALIVFGYYRRASFYGWMSAALGGVTAVAIGYEALGAFMLPACR